MSFSYTQNGLSYVVNGTALLGVAPTIIGGGVPAASAFTILGACSPAGVTIHINNHQTPVMSDVRGPTLPDQYLTNGADATISFDLYQYDQGVLQTYLEQRTAALNSGGVPTGYAVQVGGLMYDNFNLQTATALTSALWIQAPRNLYGSSIEHSWFFPRTFIDTEASFNLDTQLTTPSLRIYCNPDASGYLYYRNPIVAFTGQTYQANLTVGINQFVYGSTPS